MKQNNLLTRMLLLFALIVGSTSVWADDTESVTFSEQYENQDKPTLYTGSDFSIAFDKGSSSNAPQYYSTGTGVRMYCGSTMTFSSSSKIIKSITFTCKVNASSGTVPTSVSASTGTVDFGTISTSTTSGSWTAKDENTNSVTFTVSGSKGNVQIQTATVTFVASNNPSATLSATSLIFDEVIFGQTKEMTFTVTPANLTSALTISCNNNKYEVTPNSIASTATDAQTITVTAKPTALDDDMDGTITISGGGLAANKTVTLSTTVVKRDGVNPVGPSDSGGKFVKVTDTDDITDGQYLIVYETDAVAFNGSLTTLDTGNNVISIEFDSDGSIKATTEAIAAGFTIDATAGTVKSASGYYIGISSYSNGLKTTNDNNNPYTNTLSIDVDENLLITKTFNDGTMTLWFNANSGENNYRFRFYKSMGTTNKAIQLYKYEAGSPTTSFNVTIDSEAGYKTLVSSVDFETQEGTTAYIVTAKTTTQATLTKVDQVPAGEPVILKGSGEVTLNVAENVEAISGNLLKVSTESTGNGVYVLANGGEGVGFYEWTGGSLGAGRVYLPAPANGARAFLAFSFDEEATGVAGIEKMRNVENETFYNLAGQRVAQPTKGLYIVNGKKYIVK